MVMKTILCSVCVCVCVCVCVHDELRKEGLKEGLPLEGLSL